MLFRVILSTFTVIKTQDFEFAEQTALLQRSRRPQIQDIATAELDRTAKSKSSGPPPCASCRNSHETFDILVKTSKIRFAPAIAVGQPLPCSTGNNGKKAIEFAKAKGWTIKTCSQLRRFCSTAGADRFFAKFQGQEWEGWGGESLSKSVRQTCARTCRTPCSEIRHECADVYRCPDGMLTALIQTLDKCDAATCTPDPSYVTSAMDEKKKTKKVATGTVGGDEDNPWTVLVTATAHNVKSDTPIDFEKYRNSDEEYKFNLVFSSSKRIVTMQWAQTSWLTSRKRPLGFRSISLSDTKGAVKWAKFKGLRNCGSKAAFCSTHRQWAAVGQYRLRKGGIKAWPPRKKWGGQFIAATAELQVWTPTTPPKVEGMAGKASSTTMARRPQKGKKGN